jgi:hypothetical protein
MNYTKMPSPITSKPTDYFQLQQDKTTIQDSSFLSTKSLLEGHPEPHKHRGLPSNNPAYYMQGDQDTKWAISVIQKPVV